MSLSTATTYHLDDNLGATQDRIFITGTQAIVRMLLAQRRADRLRGLNTAGFVTGYRGSPLAGVDMALWKSKEALQADDIRFVPAVNEDMAATMIMGSQQAGTRDDRQVDGVYALWYGKGPGVDRAGDAFHHGNATGASRHGGVLLVVGDDPTAASSSIPHASEATLAALKIPVVHPATVEEYEHFGLWGWALSRYAGCWVAFKAVTDTVESGRSFVPGSIPNFDMPDHDQGLEYSAREFLTLAIEERMLKRLEAVQAFARQHRLDRLVDPAPHASLGIVSTGKASLDVSEALATLRATHQNVDWPAIRHYKVGLSWPLETQGVDDFLHGLDHVLIVEEKGPLIEEQIKSWLYNRAQRPTIVGKRDTDNEVLIPQSGQLQPSTVALALRRWLKQAAGIALPEDVAHTRRAMALDTHGLTRRPYFCSGCPHSTSTRVPEGSQALGGVGCHYMASWMDRNTGGLTQMGGEGADWVGLAPYVQTPHVFQNMGEGTYFHSGYLAIRQAVAAGATMTYKILYNDAVAMTGGQPVDGSLSVARICQQMLSEGVKEVVITTDDPDRYRDLRLPEGVHVHERHELDAVQRRLRTIPGVTVLIHDQACAAEKRRRRKKKAYPDPDRRLFINTAVCEDCGDCSRQSNCLSVVPVQTPTGRKRAIDQSTCNKDYTCVDGFCPSFVSVVGGQLKRPSSAEGQNNMARLREHASTLADPASTLGGGECNMLVIGVGGTGIVTVGAIVAMGAHLEGRAVSVLDITGLAQKGGSVVSHIRLSPDQRTTGPVRLDIGKADVAIISDVVAAAKPETLQCLAPGETSTILNTHLAPTAQFVQDPMASMDIQPMLEQLRRNIGAEHVFEMDAHELASSLFGDSIYANMIMLGAAWQRGGVPIDQDSLLRAMELNGVAVQANQDAFMVGRLAVAQPHLLRPQRQPTTQRISAPQTLEAMLEHYQSELTAYQNASYARQYRTAVERVAAAERRLYPDKAPRLAQRVARNLFKLMAYKDEYEVARLMTSPDFAAQLASQFEGDYELNYHFAPPIFAGRDKVSGRPRKRRIGPWLGKVLVLLKHGRHLRGTALDPFGYTSERQMERRVWRQYRDTILLAADRLDAASYGDLLELAGLPDMLRGFGPVKQANAQRYQAEFDRLSARLAHPAKTVKAYQRMPA